MHIVYMGTSEFAVPALQALYDAGQSVELVVTQPDRPKGRGKKMAASPVKEKALELGLKLEQPEKIRANEDFKDLLKSMSPDLIVVASYGNILPLEIMDIPAKGSVNIHASILPKHRGAAPIQRAILEGDKETGVTLMAMDEGLDEGNIIAVSKTQIDDKDAQFLHDELAIMGADLLISEISNIKKDMGEPQDDKLATYAGKIEREEGHINFGDESEYISRKARAFSKWPGLYAFYEEAKVKFSQVKNYDKTFVDKSILQAYSPGQIVRADDRGLVVRTGSGSVLIENLQFPGKKMMAVKDFLKGNKLKAKEVFK